MTLVPMLVLATLGAWLIYRDSSQQKAARRFVRVDYGSQGRRGGTTRR